MESAVSMAFSKLQVTMIEKILIAFPTRRNTLPFFVSRPIQACASETVCICALNFGMNRRAMDKTSDSAGITRPNKYTNLSEVITSL